MVLTSPDCGDTKVPCLKDILLVLEPYVQDLHFVLSGGGVGTVSFHDEELTLSELFCLEEQIGSLIEAWIEGYANVPTDLAALNAEERNELALVTLSLADGNCWRIESHNSGLVQAVREKFARFETGSS